MSLTILESITVALHSRLSAMIGDATTYPIDVREVVRPTQYGGFVVTDRQVVLTQGPMVPVPELSCPGAPGAVAYNQQFNLRLHLRQDERTTDAIDTLLNEFIGNVRKCVCSPFASWHTLGGFAMMATWGTVQPFVSEGIEGANLPLVVTYRVAENDPYTQR